MKPIMLALAAPVLATLGQLLLKSGMRQVGPISIWDLKSYIPFFVVVFSNQLILIAIGLYATGLAIWLIVLWKLDLSFAYPFLALAYVMVPLLSWLILGEYIPTMRWVGIIVVFTGIILVGWAT